MKGLYRYLSPAAPDQSGAVSVLFELGGIIVITDAGGCTGNICGFDEPRWFTKSSAVYSAGLRDMDAILGRDDRLLEKIRRAASDLDPYFIAIIGTPVPSVIATDYMAISRLAEKQLGIPTIYIETTGMEDYDVGQRKAYEAVLKLLKRGRQELKEENAGTGSREGTGAAGRLLRRLMREKGDEPAPDLGVWGATPLDLPGTGSARLIMERAGKAGYERAACYGMDSGLADLMDASGVRENLLVSWSGISAVRALEKAGIPFRLGAGAPFEAGITEEQIREVTEHVRRNGPAEMLILHQQVAAEALRRHFRELLPEMEGRITVGSFFQMDPQFMEEGDLHLEGENELIRAAGGNRFAIICGDPLYRRALGDYEGLWIDLPHYAVSGQMYMKSGEDRIVSAWRTRQE